MRSGSARPAVGRAAVAAVATVLLLSAGCGHAHWLWHRGAPPAPVPVHELDIGGPTAGTFPQYWKRNTLLVDLSAVSGSGTITLRPVEGSSWPVRLAFRVRPGSIGVLDVRGTERTVLPITDTGTATVDLELTPGMYTPTTALMTVSWGPATPAS